MPKKVKSSSPLSCETCPLFQDKVANFREPDLPTGAPATVMFIEESEEERGALAGLVTPDEAHLIYITRAVKCWKGNSADVPVKAIHHCREIYMKQELKNFTGELQPLSQQYKQCANQRIVAFGNVALHVVAGHKQKLQEVIGLPFHIKEATAWVLAVWRPLQSELVMNTQHLVDIKRTIGWAFWRTIK